MLFGSSLELPKHRPNMDPQAPHLLEKGFNKYKKTWPHVLKYCFYKSVHLNFDFVENPCLVICEKSKIQNKTFLNMNNSNK